MLKEEIKIVDEVVEPISEKRQSTIPVGFVPTPTADYREHRKLAKVKTAVGAPPVPSPIPIPIPVLVGPRVLMWKRIRASPKSAFAKRFYRDPYRADRPTAVSK